MFNPSPEREKEIEFEIKFGYPLKYRELLDEVSGAHMNLPEVRAALVQLIREIAREEVVDHESAVR